MFHALYHTPIVIAKIFMVYGPGQSDHTKLIPYVTTSLLRGEGPRLSSGVRLIDWIFVDDVVDGLIGCAETPGIEGLMVEFGSGELLSIRAVVKQLRDLLSSTVEPQFRALPDRPFEPVKKANIAKSYKLIGWRPSTSLQAGLARTVEWYEKQI